MPFALSRLALWIDRRHDAGLAERGWPATQPSYRALAQLIAVQLLAGTLVALVLAGVAPPGNMNGTALAGLATLGAAGGALLLAIPSATATTIGNATTGLVLLVGASVAAADPVGSWPLLYMWPLLLTALYTSPERLLTNCVLAIAGFAAALFAAGGSETALHDFAAFAAAVAVSVAVVRRLRLRVAVLYARLDEHTSRDPLTGVLNRAAFELLLHDWLGDGLARRQELALVLIDIDHFAQVNERGGYPDGDLALQHVADLIRREIRKTDTVGRVGGDAFAVLMPSAAGAEAVQSAERIRKTVARRCEECGHRFTLSIGIAGSGVFDNPWAEATRALGMAKDAGRDRVVLAETETAVPDPDPASPGGLSVAA